MPADSPSSLTERERQLLQWLVGGERPATVASICAYYERARGPVRGDMQTGREGAATKMLRRLEAKGFVVTGASVTLEGRRAINAR